MSSILVGFGSKMKQRFELFTLMIAAILLVNVSSPAGSIQGQQTNLEPDIWGEPVAGISLSVKATQSSFVLGKAIEISTKGKNVSVRVIGISTFRRPFEEMRLLLFDAKGKPVPRSDRAIAGAMLHHYDGPQSWSISYLDPQEVGQGSLNLQDWFKITKEGKYTLISSRKLRTWNEDFPISNAAIVNVVK